MNQANIPSTQGPQIELPNTAYILPDSIAMWPPVWWTWLVVAFIFIGLICLITYQYFLYKRNAYRRDAFQLIDSIKDKKDDEVLSHCHQIIRRCLITLGRNDLASLPSQTLFNQLDIDLPSKYQFKQLGDIFINGAYQPTLCLDPEQRAKILQLTKYWCRRHKVHA